jgi:hypothetical protein
VQHPYAEVSEPRIGISLLFAYLVNFGMNPEELCWLQR